MPAGTFLQQLTERIVNTPGILQADRDRALRIISLVATDAVPVPAGSTERKLCLTTLQMAARDDRVFAAVAGARAALGKL